MRPISWAIAGLAALFSLNLAAAAQRTDAFVGSIANPAIGYTTEPAHDAVAALAERVASGSATLTFDAQHGYLRSVLDALHISIDSQMLVLSETSAQAAHITPKTPRAIYFSDTAAVAWVKGGDDLEIASLDPRLGIVFYRLSQSASAPRSFVRDNQCLRCHLTWDTLGVPGLQMLSTFRMSDDPHAYASGVTVDQRTPFADRWGGWYVTGRVPFAHRGNVPVVVSAAQLAKTPPTPHIESVSGLVDASAYLSPYSDVAALLVLGHQAQMTNMITRVGWEARLGDGDRVRQAARDLVDYMLFVDEAPLPAKVGGASGFAARFSSQGPRDAKGRSLYQLDLEKRLLKYPCSYMIYSPAFTALPKPAKDAVYARLREVLSGGDKDNQTIREILNATGIPIG